jgi:BspA type Leucine rich repeat region (6 copies)
MKTNVRGNLLQTCLLAAALLALPAVVQAQFNFTTNNGTITITGYTGPGGDVVIPATINGLPVTSIGDYAFYDNYFMTSVTIPNSVTSIGDYAFANDDYPPFSASSLTNVTIPDSVTSIGDSAFFSCVKLTSITIGNSVTDIGDEAFSYCISLSSVTIPNSVTSIGVEAFRLCDNLTNVIIGSRVTSIGGGAFAVCTSLTSIYFTGNAPDTYLLFVGGYGGFDFNDPTIVYYLPGTLGWSNSFAGRPTAQWFLPQPLILNQGLGFGVQSGQFGFTISWATNVPVVVEACTNLANPVWLPVSTNNLVSGTSYFSDPQAANLPGRFYRLRSP